MSHLLVCAFLSGALALPGAQDPPDAPTKKLPLPGEVFAVDGRTAFVIEPPESAQREGPMPWVWYAPTLRNLPGVEETWMFERFLAAGIAIAGIDVGESYGNPTGTASYQVFYKHLSTERGYSKKPVLLARSRGGLMLYSWAVEHPGSVGAVAGIYPVCNIASYPGVARAASAFELTPKQLEAQLAQHNPIDRLAGLAAAKVPILHIHGDQDGTVPLPANSEELRRRYAAMGGPAEVQVIAGQGHNMWEGWFHSQALTDFAIAHALGVQAAPFDASKPVKVYILAGQSNMLEMGAVDGGDFRHTGFFVSEKPDAAQGVTVSVYAGAYSADEDYGQLQAVTSAAAPLGGTKGEFPTIAGPHTHVARGFLEVKDSGKYTVRPGWQDSTFNVTSLAGEEVYRKNVGDGSPTQRVLELVAGERYPVEITYFKGGTVPLWLGRAEVAGTLDTLTRKQGRFTHLLDGDGWAVRDDVHYYEARINFQGGPLTVGKGVGPELQFGHVMGDFHDAQVLVIKTAMGNRALAWDFRPPSSGPLPNRPADEKWEGREYRLMIEGVRKTLDGIADILPGYQGQGYEIAGFAWFQGHKDGGSEQWTQEYEHNLVNLIHDVRAEFRAPSLPVVIATVGFDGAEMQDNYLRILEAQLAVSGERGKYPEFAGNVLSFDTRDFWRSVEQSPRSQGYHYNRNAETYMLVGDGLGQGMVQLVGHDR